MGTEGAYFKAIAFIGPLGEDKVCVGFIKSEKRKWIRA